MPKITEKNHKVIIDAMHKHAIPAVPSAVTNAKRKYEFIRGKEKVIYLVYEGDFFLKSYYKERILGYVTYPSVHGTLNNHDQLTYLERIDYGVIHYMSSVFFWRKINEYFLHKEITSIMSDSYCDMIKNATLMKGDTFQDIQNIVNNIKLLPLSVRSKYTVLYLVEHSSFYSKRTISRVISELTKLGIIQLRGGYLK
ncbi:hypothetical protein [Enterobacter huaxiensis]|uniref:hypothetical protein n=1 Tax=Enterobacter huaxiensis TaxID=2494702 RepID=UPI0010586857|nr:hypothetical protein [Enterobacter huaxiensis]UNC52650.1 hypothetical protein D5067_0023995 [Enterobacter huaxiensis]